MIPRRLPILGGRGAVDGGGWRPGDLGAGLLAFWDAEDPASLELSGASVTNWTDRRSGYVVTQATAANKPSYDATALNGRPAVFGDAVDDRLALVPVPAALIGVAIEIWLLVDQQALVADTTARGLFYIGSSGSNNRIGISRSVSAGVNRANLVVGDGASFTVMTPSIDFSGICVLRAEVGLTSSRLSVNGIAGADTPVVPAIINTRLSMFAQNTTTGTSHSAARLNAAIVTTPLAAGDAAAMLAFLKTRGGLS